MCLSPITLKSGQSVQCGHCAECLAQYQNSVSIRLYSEMKYWKNVYMVTLTYNDDFLPVQSIYPYQFSVKHKGRRNDISVYSFDSFAEAQKVRNMYGLEMELLGDPDNVGVDSIYRVSKVFSVASEVVPTLSRHPFNSDIDNVTLRHLSPWKNNPCYDFLHPFKAGHCPVPVVSKLDVQNFFKRFRRSLEYDNLDNSLCYYVAAEYGGMQYRPHYHAVIFTDLDSLTFGKYVNKAWSSGRVEYHSVEPTYKGKTLDEFCAFLYVGKYVSKPEFDDNPYLKLPSMPKPFHLSSKSLSRRYRDELKVSFDERYSKPFAYSIALYQHDLNCESEGTFFASSQDVGEVKYHDIYDSLRRDLTSINGIPIDVLKDFDQKFYHYNKVLQGKFLSFKSPRYFINSFIPYKEELKYVFDNDLQALTQKVVRVVDTQNSWYSAIKTYIQYCNLRKLYNLLVELGKIRVGALGYEIRIAIDSYNLELGYSRFQDAITKLHSKYQVFRFD